MEDVFSELVPIEFNEVNPQSEIYLEKIEASIQDIFQNSRNNTVLKMEA